MANWTKTRLTNLLLRGSPSQTQDYLLAQDSNKVEKFAVDVNGGIRQGGVASIIRMNAVVQLTAAQINGMYAAPVPIVANPATGVICVVQNIVLELKLTATAFLLGGIVVFQYAATANGAGVLVHAGSIPASVVLGGAATVATGLWGASGASGLTIPSATGIWISNQTQAFTTGTGTGTVFIRYDLITLA